MRKIFSAILIITLLTGMLFVFSGCESSNNTTNTRNNTTSNASTNSNTSKKNASSSSNASNGKDKKESEEINVDYKASAEKQMAMPEKGEQIAIIHIKNYGDVKVKFFPEVAPKAVENFVTHAKEGYYDGITFHRIIDEFMIQGGDPLGTGTGGESIWGKDFEEELSYDLVPYRGSLCMASRGIQNSPSLGSQFYITQAHANENLANQMISYGYPKDLVEEYKKYGGYLSLYMQYTIFGQVFEGMDIVDKVAKVETDENDKPLTDVVIDSIDVTTY